MLQKIKDEPALVSGAVQAFLGLLLAFGVGLTPEQTGAILAVTAAVLAFVVRSQVVPLSINRYNEYRDENGVAYSPVWAVVVIVLLVIILLAVLGVIRVG